MPATDPTFASWLDAGNTPSSILNEAELIEVLTQAGFPHLAPVDLLAYANTKQWALATGGYTMTIGGQALTFATDSTSQSLITGKYLRLAQPNPPATMAWQFPSGFVSISAGDFAKAASAIADFIQATFDALQAVFAAIAAGTIATVAEVDQFGWPSAVAPAP